MVLASMQATDEPDNGIEPATSPTCQPCLATPSYDRENDDAETAAIRWASLFPGVGIGDWGFKQAFGSDPLFVVNRRDDPDCMETYHNQLFPRERVPRFYQDTCPKNMELDVVTVLCPCSGLSSLNNSRGANKLGGDAPQNLMMSESLEFALAVLAPAVLIGENGEKLATATGRKVVDALTEIGRVHGYSATFFSTCTTLHGVPQRRRRTFYLFWKSRHAPMLRWTAKETPSLEDYLRSVSSQATMQDVFVNHAWHGTKPTGYAPYSLLLSRLEKRHGDNLEEGGPPCGRTVMRHLYRLGLVTETIDTLGDGTDDRSKRLLERYAIRWAVSNPISLVDLFFAGSLLGMNLPTYQQTSRQL